MVYVIVWICDVSWLLDFKPLEVGIIFILFTVVSPGLETQLIFPGQSHTRVCSAPPADFLELHWWGWGPCEGWWWVRWVSYKSGTWKRYDLWHPPGPQTSNHSSLLHSLGPSCFSSLPEIAFSLDFKPSPSSSQPFCLSFMWILPSFSTCCPHLPASLVVSHGEYQALRACGDIFPSDYRGF